jgi:uncharacterized membrane protein
MVLMAIDHVRVYSGQPAGGPTPGIFFTRWITHFVAPAFVFLAGTSAYLYGQRVGDRKRLARFLVTRGLWLVLLELTVLRVAWTFNFDFAHYLLAGVIWMIGWCMVLMSAIVFLPHAAIAVGSVAILLGHNLADVFPAALSAFRQGSAAWLWKILYLGGGIKLGENGPPLVILFVIVPWIAVMAAGYAFGPVMSASPERRRSVCMRLGLAMIAAFILLRGLDAYGDPRPWRRGAPPANRVAQSQATTSTAPPGQAARPPAAAPRPQMPRPLAFLNTGQVSGVTVLLVDDARADVCAARARRIGEGTHSSRARDVWARSVLLLSVAHPADSPCGLRCVAVSRGIGESVVVRESPDDEWAGA